VREEKMRRDLVVIGASAGGIDAVRAILAALPRELPASVCVVLHTSADSPGILDRIFAGVGTLRAVAVEGTERMRPGTIYVPPPDHHLVVAPSTVSATRGPRENRFRPAIDPLFRSAAQAYGPRVIGVILTGGLDDGTAGLWAVKRMGGVAVVQDPDDALVPSMPRSALAHVAVDHCAPLADIASLITRLATEDIAEQGGYTVPETMKTEVKIANEEQSLEAGVEQLGEPSTYACPECHGVLLAMKEGDRVRFRCHTGHAYSSESLITEFDDAIDAALWNAVRALQEKVILIRSLAEHAREKHDAGLAEALLERAHDAYRKSEQVRRAAVESGPQAVKGKNSAAAG
jgi:two-component system chemotaxis response regulator CheB